jgi:hypothetical protein
MNIGTTRYLGLNVREATIAADAGLLLTGAGPQEIDG